VKARRGRGDLGRRSTRACGGAAVGQRRGVEEEEGEGAPGTEL
jgi:hypothetical protein